MTATALGARANDIFVGTGEMATLCRSLDWAATPLGLPSGWSNSLRTIVATMLASRHPMFLLWGPDLIQLYNDGYRPSLGETGRHPRALGMGGRETWTDIWHTIGPEIESIMAGGEASWHEDQLVPIERNGQLEQVYWTYSYSPVRDDDWSVGGVLVVVQERTAAVQALAERGRLLEAERVAREETEEARNSLARVFAQAPVAIAVVSGRELRFTVANAKYQQMIGNRDPVGKSVIEMFPELAASEITALLDNVYNTGVPFIANDFHVRFDSQGTGEIDNYYDFVYHPIGATENRVEAIVAVVVDVTQRHRVILERERLLAEAERARAEAERARTEAESANRGKSDFLAVMSHELRTPLNAIGGYVDLMQMGIRGPLSDAQRHDLACIEKSQRHLLGLINEVLNYSRIEAGVMHYQLQPVTIYTAVTTCIELLTPQFVSCGLSLRAVGCDEALSVYADADKLQQILLNLLTNASKFTLPGGSVSISCSAEADSATIAVCDTGIGIPPDKLAGVFDPFIQVDTRLTRTAEGVGLGLAISRDLANAMGGGLTAMSVVGTGSTFTLRLPRWAP